MGKTFGAGLLFIAAGIVTVIVGGVFDLKIDTVFFGLAVGGVLAMVNENSGTVGRLGAFLIGVVITMAGYIIRILALNESILGQLLYGVLVALLIIVICAATSNRLPLWSGILGIVLVTGTYEASFLQAPQDIQTQLFSTVSMALVPMAIAFLAGIFLKPELVGVETQEDKEIDELASRMTGSNETKEV